MPRKSASNPRSDLVAIRITPKMRFGLELLAKQYDRTLTDTVILAINNFFGTEKAGLFLEPQVGYDRPVNVLDIVWSPQEHERFALVAIYYPELLSDNEDYLWRVIKRSDKYWKGRENRQRPTPDDFNFEALLEDWKELKKQAKIVS